jgi:hypothetical protein
LIEEDQDNRTLGRLSGLIRVAASDGVNVRFGLKLNAGFLIGGNAALSFSSIDTAYQAIQSGVPGALDYR